MNKFSIILPVKNGGAYAKDCIRSILCQTLNNFDLIILDNCSTDDTLAWVVALNDPRVVIHTSDRPLSIGENWGRICKVKKNGFMTMIGHDDLLLPDYLQTMDQLIMEYPNASLYQSHFRYIDSEGTLVRHCQSMPVEQHVSEFLACQLDGSRDSTGTGYMMRSADYDELGGISPLYPNLIFADYELWMKLTSKSYVVTSAEETFCYRLHNSVSRVTNGEDYQQAFGIYMRFLSALRDTDSSIAVTLNRHGKAMLYDFCESLSHRLLKTPVRNRKTKVGIFIEQCRMHARSLIPGQRFSPLTKPGIFAAWVLDNPPGRALFSLIKNRRR